MNKPIKALPYTINNGIRWLKDPYAFLNQASADHGLTFRINLPGMKNALLSGEPNLIQEIIGNKNLVGGKGINFMRSIFGGQFTMSLYSEIHKTRRRAYAGIFQNHELARYDQLTEQATLEALRDAPFGVPFSMFEIAQKITQIVIVRLVFGNMASHFEAEALELVHAFMTSFHNPLVLFIKPMHLNLGRYSPWGRIVYNRRRLQEFILKRVQLFREQPEEEYTALAQMTLHGEMNDSDLATELTALLMLGHDTTSVALAWALAHIYNHPKILERLSDDTSIAQNSIKESSFLQACIDESMRLSPAVTQLFRVAEQDMDILGHSVKKGCVVMPCIYVAHHNPQVFDQPNLFLPERFMNGNSYQNSFFPFGLGTRLCAGKPLARRQMPIIISTLIKNFNLELAPGYNPEPARYMMFVAPRMGALLIKKNQDQSVDKEHSKWKTSPKHLRTSKKKIFPMR